MAYSYKKLDEKEEEEVGPVYRTCSCCSDSLDQFAILDPQGDRITVVYDESEAQGLISHLNR